MSRLSPEDERELRFCSRAAKITMPGALLRDAIAELDAARAALARANVCEACGDCLEPVPPRCERHVHTEPGDPEWTMESP